MAASTFRGVDIPPANDDRLALERVVSRVPGSLRLGLRLFPRLPMTSRLRRRALQVALSRGFAATNRRDLWVIQVGYEPDCEIHIDTGFRTLGLAECYHGYEGWRELIEAVEEELPDVRWWAEHVVDLGDRGVLRAGMTGTGRASGVPTHQTWGSVYHLSPRGRIARQDVHWTWADALAAAGLREGR